jgi:large subunit ribosomal protein L25
MTATQTYPAAIRTAKGTTAMSRLRKEGQVPVNVSKKGSPSTLLQMDARSAELFDKRVHHLAKLAIEGKEITVLRGAIEKNVLNDKVQHLDLIEVDESTEVTVQVAVVPTLLGCPGVKAGGIVEQSLRSINVRCKASAIPDAIAVDMTSVGLQETVYSDKLTFPEGVKPILRGGRRLVVLSISVPRGMSTAADAVAAAGATPAAGAAAPAAAAAAAPAKAAPAKK